MKNIFGLQKGEAKRVLGHIPIGILITVLIYVHWALGIAMLALFIIYELNQDKYISDEGFKDIKGACWGVGLSGIIMFGLQLGGFL